MKLRHYFATLALLLTGILHAAMQRENYPCAKDLKLQTGASTAIRFGSFTVDEELFNELNLQNNNLRIINKDGAETPFLLRTKRGERKVVRDQLVPSEKISFKKLPGNQIELIMKKIDSKERTLAPQSIVLLTGIKNFEKHVSIYCSNNQTEWRLIAERKPIFDYSKYININNSRISFTPEKARYFKIVISNITEKKESPFTRLTRETRGSSEFATVESSSFTRTDFKINEIQFYHKTTKLIKDKALKQPCSSSDFKVSCADKKSLISFSTVKAPLTEITLLTETPYYYRRFMIETTTNSESWRIIHTGIISSVNNDTKEQKTIRLPQPTRAANYRITIYNNDSPPLKISGIELEGESREIVFYCDQRTSYTMIYGAKEAKTPVYDIGQVLTQTKSDATVLYKAGTQKVNPNYNKTVASTSTLSRRTIMTIAVILMVAVLGWLIFKTAKSISV